MQLNIGHQIDIAWHQQASSDMAKNKEFLK